MSALGGVGLARQVAGAACVALLVVVVGIVPAGAVSRPAGSVSPAIAVLQISTTPALQPAFDPAVSDYVSLCSEAAPVVVSVAAPTGTTVSVEGQAALSGSFTASVSRAVGQSFSFTTLSAGVPSTFYVRCLPADYPPITTTRTGVSQAEYYMVSPIATTSFGPPPPPLSTQYVSIVDGNGVPVWWYNVAGQVPPNVPATDFDRLPDGNLAFTFGGQGGGPLTNGGSFELSLAGNIVRSMNTVGVSEDGHDIQMLPNGNFLLEAYPIRTNVDLSAIGGSANATIEDAEIQVVTPSGILLWKWDALAHVPVTELEPSLWAEMAAASQADIYHINSVAYDPATGNVVTSLRHESGVYAINPSTGAIVWKVGGTHRPESLTIIGDPVGGPVGQHDARLTSAGVLSLYDNGAERAAIQPHAPRAVRYQLDTTAGTATFIDQVTDPAVPTSVCCGSARRLDGGNWVIGWGFNDRITETTATGTPVMTMSFAGSLFSYRAIPLSPGVLTRAALRDGMNAQHPVGLISVGSVDLTRGNSGGARLVLFPITLSQPSTSPVTVHYEIGPDGTAYSASSPTDFLAVAGTVTFNPTPGGVTPNVQYVATLVNPDAFGGPGKTFSVLLTNPTGGYQIGHGIGVGLILPDLSSSTPRASIGDALIWNGTSGNGRVAIVPVTLSRPAAATLTVTVTVADGTAKSGTDYLAQPTATVTFSPGQTEQFVYIGAIPMATVTPSRTVNLSLSNPHGGLSLFKATGLVLLG